MSHQAFSYLLVAVQFLCLLAIAVTGPIIARSPLWLAVELLGVALGLWAVWSMGLGNFNVTPAVKVEGFLVERGPYAWIRHPMYAALLLVAGALVAAAYSHLRLVLLLLLLVDLLVKLHHEERLLAAHYPTYADYMAATKRLIPYVY